MTRRRYWVDRDDGDGGDEELGIGLVGDFLYHG